MIGQSLGGFFLFERYLPRSVKRELKQVYHDLDLELMYPAGYPPLHDLPLAQERDFVDQYKLSGDVDSQEIVFADEEPEGRDRNSMASFSNGEVLLGSRAT